MNADSFPQLEEGPQGRVAGGGFPALVGTQSLEWLQGRSGGRGTTRVPFSELLPWPNLELWRVMTGIKIDLVSGEEGASGPRRLPGLEWP